MTKILTMNRTGFACLGRGNVRQTRKKTMSNCSIFNMEGSTKKDRILSQDKEEINVGSRGIILILSGVVIFFGVFYLYQVNNLATKGYEIREMESKIATLNDANRKNKIYEMELRSMHNIEKEMQDLNLVSPTNITYLDMNGSVAMK